MKRAILSVFSVILSITSAYSTEIDSLQSVLSQLSTPHEKVAVYQALGLKFCTKNTDSAKMYLQRAAAIVQDQDIDSMSYLVDYYWAEYYQVLGGLDSTLYYVDRCTEKCTEGEIYAKALNLKAEVFRQEGQYDQALEMYFAALEAFPNDLHFEAWVKNNLGLALVMQGEYDKARNYFLESQLNFERLGNQALVAQSHNNLAMAAYYQDDHKEAASEMKKAMAIYTSMGHESGRASALNNIGAIYLEEGMVDSAIHFLARAKAVYEHQGNLVNAISTELNMGKALSNAGRFDEAASFLMAGLQKSKENALKEQKKYAYDFLSHMYQLQNDFKNALKYRELYMTVKDSIYTEQKSQQVAALEAKYNSSQKQEQIAKLELETQMNATALKEKTTERNMFLGIACILLVLAGGVFLYWRHRQRLTQTKLALEQSHLEKVLKESEVRYNEAQLSGQEKERKRIAQELHDGLGSSLSALKLQLSNVDSPHATKAIGMVDAAVDEVRRISHNLSTIAVSKLGLHDAIQNICDALNAGAMNVTFQAYGQHKKLPSTLEVLLYRCTQELLNNAVKHANANVISVQLTFADSTLNIVVEDDGRGFSQKKVAKADGIGLRNCQLRLEGVGGSLEIDAARGRGTVVILEVPVT